MSIDDESLICPITQEYFRDPVLAEDGRLYEREAITRWINEHGTSPFTRQILNVNYLLPDNEIRKRIEQRRRLSVTYTRDSDQVQLPPIRLSHKTHLPVNIGLPPDLTHQYQSQRNIRVKNTTSRCSQCITKICFSSGTGKFAHWIVCSCVIFCLLLVFLFPIITISLSTLPQSTSTTKNDVSRIPSDLCYASDART